jgi:hypothetical protein
MLFHVQEVGRAQMLVSLVRSGIQAGRLDLSLHVRAVGILLVHYDGPGDLPESSLHRGDHHVLGRELHQGMIGIDLPGGNPGSSNLLLNCAHRRLHKVSEVSSIH